MTIKQIIDKVKENDPEADVATIEVAYEYALKAHKGQLRRTGEPYIEHSLHTAHLLAQIGVDVETIAAGLLHDVPEDTEYTLEDIEKLFGKDIAGLVEGITKLSKIKYRGVERYVESLKKMFLAMAYDLRVILIKFADRLHNLRTLEALPLAKRERIARETMEIYAPIAGLLGVWRLKWQMEDLCFKYLYPEEFKTLEYKYEVEKKAERNKYIHKINTILRQALDQNKIEHEVTGRFKHLYSIWKKMQRKDKKFDEIYDVFALRVIVPTIADCYKTLGIIHSLWHPIISRFKDYISVPKPNGYRSIHTTVIGPDGKATEFQIRTPEMNKEAMYGIAAHYNYKQTSGIKDEPKKQLRWVKEVLDMQRTIQDSHDFIKQLKFDVFKNRIFVLTPRGDVYDLPEGSTPVDFAYAVHTEVGNKCMGAIINDKMGSLDAHLNNGDLVEIVIDKKRKGPSRDWLKFVRTHKARSKIRQFAPGSPLAGLRKFIPGIK